LAGPLSITIVTPTLNAALYLEQCLTSIQVQGCADLEHLVVDGGSTDATEQIIRASTAHWLPLPGLRQSAAINAGLRAASGEIVAWLNADDLYEPGALRYVQERFAADPQLDVLLGDCMVIDEYGKSLSRLSPGPYDFDRLLRHGNSIGQPAVFLRRRVFQQVGYLDEALDLGMDYDLWLRLRNTRTTYVPRVLASFRWHTGSKTATNLYANWHELLIIVRRYGGDWTPALAWSYARARLTAARMRVTERLLPAR
jgi:glycosyltransferase involved in cell wall biosynthesis